MVTRVYSAYSATYIIPIGWRRVEPVDGNTTDPVSLFLVLWLISVTRDIKVVILLCLSPDAVWHLNLPCQLVMIYHFLSGRLSLSKWRQVNSCCPNNSWLLSEILSRWHTFTKVARVYAALTLPQETQSVQVTWLHRYESPHDMGPSNSFYFLWICKY